MTTPRLRQDMRPARPLAPPQVLRQDLLFAFRAKIDLMLKHFTQQCQLAFTGSSILLVYDGHRPAPAAVAPMPRRRSSALAGGAERDGGSGGGGQSSTTDGSRAQPSGGVAGRVRQRVGSVVESALGMGGVAAESRAPLLAAIQKGLADSLARAHPLRPRGAPLPLGFRREGCGGALVPTPRSPPPC